jgi:long-chain acyl-CoA synthetase
MENEMRERSNVISRFFITAKRLGDSVCVHYKRDNIWATMSWNEMADLIKRTASGLRKMGIVDGERVALFAQTRLEWTIADMAILAAGGVTVPIYQSLAKDRLASIILDSRPVMAIVENEWMGTVFDDALQRSGVSDDVRVLYMEQRGDAVGLLGLGEDATSEEMARIGDLATQIDNEADATIVYTSGTTGDLKGVVLSHENLIGETDGAIDAFGFSNDDIGLLCLPLAHVLGRMMQFYTLVQGTQTAYAESIQKLAQNYLEIRPHYVVAVPRMLEKIYERVMEHVDGISPFLRFFMRWALEAGRKRTKFLMRHQGVPFATELAYRIASVTVFRMLRNRLGGRLTHCVCGGAFLPEEVAQFFYATGIIVMEGYGLTETFAAATVNRADDFRFGTVGKPLSGVEVKISADGEILIRGRTTFKEYLNHPDATACAFDETGWFKTGDLGEFSRDGFLRITGRIKDIIVTAGGKNVAPQMIEALMMKSSFIDHFVVCGDGRKFLTALITLNTDAVQKYLKRHGFADVSGAELSDHPEVRGLIGKHVEEQNGLLARFETIKRFAILDGALSIDGGVLTPTYKVRRKAISSKYGEIIDSLYEG